MYKFKKSLYIIGIPIGNIYDFSQRAIFILKNVNIIATEDSRKCGKILNFLNIKNKIVSLNDINEISISKKLIDEIKKNSSVAFISDSGTPLISDPGFYLIDLAYKNQIEIIPIPGISSITTALSISIIKSNDFIFHGFLPKNNIQKIYAIKNYLEEVKNIIFFETTERLINTLFIIQNIIQNNRQILIFKNLTKKFEMYISFEIIFLKSFIKNITNFKKGELIIILSGKNNIYNITTSPYAKKIYTYFDKHYYRNLF